MSAPVQFDGLDRVALPPRPLHLAIGMFDGVHLGHQAVIGSAVHSAQRGGGLAGVLTFWPHPSALFHPQAPTRLIMNPAMKTRVLRSLGVAAVIQQHFTPEFARITAEEFLPFLRRKLPGLAAVYVGENWRFGRGRLGDVALLVAEAEKLGLEVMSSERLNRNGRPVSSTRIRDHLLAGEIAEANRLFGYAYFADGAVAGGRRLGRTLGFPTLNLPWEPELRPRYGVYAVRVSGANGAEKLPGVANYGVRPTVGEAARPLLETHVLGPCPFGEGDAVTVEWLQFLRPEQKFAGVEELSAQIARDAAAARKYFQGAAGIA